MGLRLPTIYLNHACQMTPMTSNVLTFWKDNKEKYPAFARLFITLAIPASSAPAERISAFPKKYLDWSVVL